MMAEPHYPESGIKQSDHTVLYYSVKRQPFFVIRRLYDAHTILQLNPARSHV